MNRAFFIDRDGVLIEEEDYLDSPERVRLIKGAPEALAAARKNGYLCVVVSNQSGVARGYFEERTVMEVHNRIDELLVKAGARPLDAYYYCPHHPKGVVEEFSVDCDCRKPAPGLFLRAAADFDIDLAESFMIGDKASDIKAAENAGLKASVLVKTGYGPDEVARLQGSPATVADDILSAVRLLLAPR